MPKSWKRWLQVRISRNIGWLKSAMHSKSEKFRRNPILCAMSIKNLSIEFKLQPNSVSGPECHSLFKGSKWTSLTSLIIFKRLENSNPAIFYSSFISFPTMLKNTLPVLECVGFRFSYMNLLPTLFLELSWIFRENRWCHLEMLMTRMLFRFFSHQTIKTIVLNMTTNDEWTHEFWQQVNVEEAQGVHGFREMLFRSNDTFATCLHMFEAPVKMVYDSLNFFS